MQFITTYGALLLYIFTKNAAATNYWTQEWGTKMTQFNTDCNGLYNEVHKNIEEHQKDNKDVIDKVKVFMEDSLTKIEAELEQIRFEAEAESTELIQREFSRIQEGRCKEIQIRSRQTLKLCSAKTNNRMLFKKRKVYEKYAFQKSYLKEKYKIKEDAIRKNYMDYKKQVYRLYGLGPANIRDTKKYNRLIRRVRLDYARAEQKHIRDNAMRAQVAALRLLGHIDQALDELKDQEFELAKDSLRLQQLAHNYATELKHIGGAKDDAGMCRKMLGDILERYHEYHTERLNDPRMFYWPWGSHNNN